jgi:hypothetical protein
MKERETSIPGANETGVYRFKCPVHKDCPMMYILQFGKEGDDKKKKKGNAGEPVVVNKCVALAEVSCRNK